MFDFTIPEDLSWRVYSIEKERHPGEYRKITEPNPTLMKLHKRILLFLYNVPGLKPHEAAHGFIPKRNVNSALSAHTYGADVFVRIDVHHFFDTFPVSAARDALCAGMSDVLADKIMKVCTYRGTIPQGGPCSPYLTNLGMYGTDNQVSNYARKHGFEYTRYADDMWFTLKLKPGERAKKSYWFLVYGVGKILRTRLGLKLNRDKCSVFYSKGKQRCRALGQTIRKDGKGFDAEPKFRRDTRAAVHNLARKVLNQNKKATSDDWLQWQVIKGRVAWMDNVRALNIGGADTADPVIQEKWWNVLEEVFSK